jgi:hypothetical protein
MTRVVMAVCVEAAIAATGAEVVLAVSVPPGTRRGLAVSVPSGRGKERVTRVLEARVAMAR